MIERLTILRHFTSGRHTHPFVRGDHDYATNGRIVVRLPRTNIDDVGIVPGAPAAELVFERVNWEGPFSPPPWLKLPERRWEECRECEGNGTRHSCPHCECECHECDGAGRHDSDEGQSININGCPVALGVARRVLALAQLNLRLGPTPPAGHNWPFLFDGGEGVFATLGSAARERLAREFEEAPPKPEPKKKGKKPGGAAAGAEPEENEEALPPGPPPKTMGAEDVAGARAQGAQAHKSGVTILKNPYVAGDPRRASWDEGWCSEAGSDGMDIPAAFRRTKKKPDEDAPAPDGGDAPEGAPSR